MHHSKPLTFHHVTLNTGHVLTHDAFAIGPAPSRALAAFCFGTPPPPPVRLPHPFSDYSAQVAGSPQSLAFTVRHHAKPAGSTPIPLLTCYGTLRENEELWARALSDYRSGAAAGYAPPLSTILHTPPAPWLAVVLYASISAYGENELGWLGDFERCLFHHLADDEG